ncbi:MAG: RsmB/NOP family class I SAM-dependent RNA methyltransferase [Gammaproteobacteria bacterium]
MVTSADIPFTLERFVARLAEIHPAGVVNGIVETMRAPKRVGYFLNPLVDAAVEPWGEPIAGLEGCYVVPDVQRQALLASQATRGGAVYPINPSSALAVANLEVAGAAEVLDLAAAPGGKTLLMAAAMGNGGRIAAVEPVKGRFHRMRANLARCGATNVQYYQADGRSIGRKVPDRFYRVLLVAPCSSEARFRLDDPGSFAHWTSRKVRECARKQRGLIRSAFTALKPGGTLLYCTCSFAPEENELIVAHLLEAEPAAEVLPVGGGPGCPGLVAWRGRSLDARLAGTRRIIPDDLFDGFYLARIGKA